MPGPDKEMKKVMLPVCEPIFSTYNYQITQCVVANENPELYTWFINQCVGLQCTNMFLQDLNTPKINIEGLHNIHAMPHLDRIPISLCFSVKYIDQIVKNILDAGYYAAFRNVDDYYMKGKTFYKTMHYYHDGLIYGYDDSKRVYNIIAYDKDFKCGMFETPYTCLKKGAEPKSGDWKFCQLIAMKARRNKINLNIKVIKSKLQQYLNSNMELYRPKSKDLNVYGTAVHDYIALYLDMLYGGEIPYENRDRRILRVIWEHKKLMTKRIRIIEEKLKMDDEISKRYAEIESEADKLRLMYLKYNLKMEQGLLPIIIKRSKEMKKSEEEILRTLILRIERRGDLTCYGVL